MKVRLKQTQRGLHDLTPGNTYHVIGIEADDYRIMNDFGRPYLYPPRLFTLVDKSSPDDWREKHGADGERYAYPPTLNKPGFFEAYFDGDLRTMATLHEHLAGLSLRRRQRA